MITDPIADMLTRIRNATKVGQKKVFLPYSKAKETIVKILVKEGYLKEYKLEKARKHQQLVLTLLYKKGKPVITCLKRISKPSLRVYHKAKKLPKALSGWGKTIVSTSKGLMTDKEAKKANLGGEVIFQIW